MKRLLQMVIVLGAMMGLFGQEFALASVTGPAQAQTASKMAMTEDCMSRMAAATADEDWSCKGLTLACIAAMGCTIPLVVPTDHVLPAPAARPAPIHRRSASRQLAGRDLAPEPDPPALG